MAYSKYCENLFALLFFLYFNQKKICPTNNSKYVQLLDIFLYVSFFCIIFFHKTNSSFKKNLSPDDKLDNNAFNLKWQTKEKVKKFTLKEVSDGWWCFLLVLCLFIVLYVKQFIGSSRDDKWC